MKQLLSTKDIVSQQLLPYAETTLRMSRHTGLLGGRQAPPHLKVGRRVYYEPKDLTDWMGQFKKRHHTGERAA